MDIVGNISYKGQAIEFVDQENFIYPCGKAVAVYDILKGPKQLIFKTSLKSEDDISYDVTATAVNWNSNFVAVAKKGGYIEILKLPLSSDSIPDAAAVFRVDEENSVSSEITNSKIHCPNIECVRFSRGGDRVYALTGISEHKLLVWGKSDDTASTAEPVSTLSTRIIEFPLSSTYHTCEPSPIDRDYFFLLDQNTGKMAIGYVLEILKKYSIKLEVITLNMLSGEESNDIKLEEEEPAAIKLGLWLPNNLLLICTESGDLHIIDCDINNMSSTHIGKLKRDDSNYSKKNVTPTHAILTSTHVIVGTAEGYLLWYSIDNQLNIDCEQAQQVCTLEYPVAQLAIDRDRVTLLVTSMEGMIFKVPVEVPEQEENAEDPEDKAVSTPQKQKLVCLK